MTVELWTYTHSLILQNNNNSNNSNNNNSNNNSNNNPPGAGHRVVVEGLSSQSVRPLWRLTGEARSRPGVTVAGGPPVQSDTGQNYYIV